jgi:hypothetical protein
MTTLSLAILTAGLLGTAVPSLADLICSDNLLVNCNFQGGLYTLTYGGNVNNTVPDSWIPNSSFVYDGVHNGVVGYSIGPQFQDLEMGSYLSLLPTPTLSQTFSDTSGAAYSGLVSVLNSGPGNAPASAIFDVLINGVAVVTLDDTAPGSYVQYAFSFTGSGSDTITLEGASNPGYWIVNAAVVTAEAPEPTYWALLGAGTFVLLAFRARRSKTAAKSLI